jgi:hypothetical protein
MYDRNFLPAGACEGKGIISFGRILTIFQKEILKRTEVREKK